MVSVSSQNTAAFSEPIRSGSVCVVSDIAEDLIHRNIDLHACLDRTVQYIQFGVDPFSHLRNIVDRRFYRHCFHIFIICKTVQYS